MMAPKIQATQAIKLFKKPLCPALTIIWYVLASTVFAQDSTTGVAEDRRSIFDFNVVTHLVCKATTEGKEKEGLERLLGMGLKLDRVYFDIICPGNYSLLLTSLISDNYQGANYYLRYLRWRERETKRTYLRSSILNDPNTNGETLIDVTSQFIKQTSDKADKVRLQAFLKLFKKHGGECKKYCKN